MKGMKRFAGVLLALALATGPACAWAPAQDPGALPRDGVFAFPNPARVSTTIRFETSSNLLDARIRIFDVTGRMVKEISRSDIKSPKPGLCHATWDLRNMSGAAVASGVYIFVVGVSGSDGRSHRVVKKLAVVK